MFQLTNRPLSLGIEGSYRLKRVTEKIQANGRRSAGRIEIDNAAPDGVVARIDDRPGSVEAVFGEVGLQHVDIDAVAGRGTDPCLGDDCRIGNTLENGVHRREDDIGRFSLGNPRQSGNPFRDDIRARRNPVIGQTVPGGQPVYGEVRSEEAKSLFGRREPLIVSCDVEDGALLLCSKRARVVADRQAVEAFGYAAQQDATRWFQATVQARSLVNPVSLFRHRFRHSRRAASETP